ncbi:MAG: hypothetical protein OP8BY_1453 [Candidatus Saccharicenans subterraneus]|uniref:Uncharacterized protein n=1 Tax=Candidatus Saccharicenans subterraneus TaxID=2508984 RepID=A0A3E2BJE4_9BACT|nr:MAG: hypothetical protein OP8BY_1453 [Candidatus Saccharicenans subterraneum]
MKFFYITTAGIFQLLLARVERRTRVEKSPVVAGAGFGD